MLAREQGYWYLVQSFSDKSTMLKSCQAFSILEAMSSITMTQKLLIQAIAFAFNSGERRCMINL